MGSPCHRGESWGARVIVIQTQLASWWFPPSRGWRRGNSDQTSFVFSRIHVHTVVIGRGEGEVATYIGGDQGAAWLHLEMGGVVSVRTHIYLSMLFCSHRNIFPQERRSSIQAGYRLPVYSCPSCPHCGSLELLWLSYCSGTGRGGRTHIWKVL